MGVLKHLADCGGFVDEVSSPLERHSHIVSFDFVEFFEVGVNCGYLGFGLDLKNDFLDSSGGLFGVFSHDEDAHFVHIN